MKLYYAPGACSLAPHIVLRESGLKFDLDKVDFSSRKTASGEDFNAVNPKGSVPTLRLDNGDVLTEGAVLMQYIADKAPGSKLAPAAGTDERYRLMELLNYIASEVHKGFSPLFHPATPDGYKDIAKQNLAKKFAFLDKKLQAHDYIAGSAFTVADAYLFTVLRWTERMKIDLSGYPGITAFMKRIAERPKVQEALKEEGLLKAA